MADFINTIDALGDDAVIDSIIDRSITEFKDDKLTSICNYAFHSCTNLADVDLPNVTVINGYAFCRASITSSLNLPKLTQLKGYTFQHAVLPEIVRLPSFTHGSTWDLSYTSGMKHLDLPIATNVPNRFCCNCGSLETVNLPKVETIYQLAFGDYYGPGGNKLRRVDLPVCTSIHADAFTKAMLLNVVILRASTICTLGNTNVFTNTPIASGTGYIYVPRDLVDSYKAATNWSTYADQFRAIEDYSEDGTVTGDILFRYSITNALYDVSNNNDASDIKERESYHATLTSTNGEYIDDVKITMAGVDITDSVYNAETGEIAIESATGDIVIIAGVNMSVLYNLPEPTTFNGTSDYIDTGIKLFDIAKDFTIVCTAAFGALANNICLFHCMNEASPYPGLCVDGTIGVRIAYTGASSLTTSISNKTTVSTLVIRYKAGVMDRICYKNTSGAIVTVNHNTNTKYTTINQNLLLGAYQTTAGVKGRYFKGTISGFTVYASSLSDDEIATLLGG